MAESLWKRFAQLPLGVESYELERLEQPVTRGFSRVTTVVRLHGGEEGVGEDVTWYAEAADPGPRAGPVPRGFLPPPGPREPPPEPSHPPLARARPNPALQARPSERLE